MFFIIRSFFFMRCPPLAEGAPAEGLKRIYVTCNWLRTDGTMRGVASREYIKCSIMGEDKTYAFFALSPPSAELSQGESLFCLALWERWRTPAGGDNG